MSNGRGEAEHGLHELALRYDCAKGALPPELAAAFVALAHDAAAQRFVAQARAAPHGRVKTALYALLRRALSDYDAYGLLRMYPMHLLSAQQLEPLLGAPPGPRPWRLLDVGAGNGDITALAAPRFDQVLVTEASAVMRQRLRARGFRVLPLDLAQQPPPPALRAHAMLCLNVLDRCTRPRTLLRHLRAALAPGARLLLSVPLPLSPHVQRGASTSDPDEPLPPAAPSWEAGAAGIARGLLAPAGLRVLQLSRAPYLCRGDATTPLYVLDTALFVCSADADARPDARSH